MPKLIVLESSDSPESLVQKLRQLVNAQEQELEDAELELLGLRAELDERKLEIEELHERYNQAADIIRFALDRLGALDDLEARIRARDEAPDLDEGAAAATLDRLEDWQSGTDAHPAGSSDSVHAHVHGVGRLFGGLG